MDTNYRTGERVVYDDGRAGHRGVRAQILSVGETAMTVQFDDRAMLTTIRFSDKAWMDFIKREEV